MDMMGPFQTTTSGNKYSAVVTDYMTNTLRHKLCQTKAPKQQLSLCTGILFAQGTPAEVVTDQGGEFQGHFQALLDKCIIDHRLTSPYHPQANGLTEGAKQTINRALVKMTKEDPHNWDKQIPTILMGYRASRQASTRYSPFYQLHGHDMVLPVNNQGRTLSADHGELSESFLYDLFGPSRAVIDNAHANIIKAQEKQKKSYANRHLHGVKAAFPRADPTAQTPVSTRDHDKIPVVAKSPVTTEEAAPSVTVQPETTTTVTKAAQAIKRRARPQINKGDFIVAKIHKWYENQESARASWA